MASGDTKTEALLNILGNGGSVEGITGCGNTKTQDYLVDAINRLQGIENEVEEIKNNPDVVDIVDTYADLQSYDTQHLSDNDIIRVLQDETHDGNSTYYRFNKNAGTWTFIGEIASGSGIEYVDLTLTGTIADGFTFTASKYLDEVLELVEDDKKVVFRVTIPTGTGLPTEGTYELPIFNWSESPGKALAMTMVDLNGTVYAINCVYYAFAPGQGTHFNTGIIEVLIVPTGGGNFESKELTTADYNDDPNNPRCVSLWLLPDGFYHKGSSSVKIYAGEYGGYPETADAFWIITKSANQRYVFTIQPGSSGLSGDDTFVMKSLYNPNPTSSTPLSTVSYGITRNILGSQNVVDNLTSTDTKYPLSAKQGKALKDLINGLVISGAGAPTTSTVGTVGQLYEDTTNGKLYQCTAVDNTDPNAPVYTWTEVGAGGSGGTGLARVLTNDDYNANSNNWSDTDPTHFNCIAMWKMPSGVYTFKPSGNNSSVSFRLERNTGKTASDIISQYIVIVSQPSPDNNNSQGQILFYDGINSCYVTGIHNDGQNATVTDMKVGVVDNLTSYSISKALSANQGRVLNEKIEGRVITGAGAPTTSTVGTVGKLYEDTTNGKLYQCTAVTPGTDPDPTTYTWTEVGAGGSGPTVVQTTGTSQTDVMSQNATTDLIYADPGTNSKIRIGTSSNINGSYPISIGFGTFAQGNNEIAIGKEAIAGGNAYNSGNTALGGNATATGGNYRTAIGFNAKAQSGNHSVALGSYAVAGRAGEVNIGTGTNSYGYNSTSYRVLGGVHDPVDAHDAATKGYVDSHAGGSNLVHEITDADFNWNSTTWSAQEPYDSVALWKLVTKPGFTYGWYVANTSSSPRVYADNDGLTIHNGMLMYLGSNGEQMFINPSSPQDFITYRAVDYTTGDVIEDSEATIPVNIMSVLNDNLTEMWDYVPFADQGAPDQNYRGTLGQLYTDTDTMHTYQCTAIDDSDPDEENWLYTWTQRW